MFHFCNLTKLNFSPHQEREIDDDYLGFTELDGECRLRLNEKTTVPYVPDGFTLHLNGVFMAIENIEHAIANHIKKVPEIEDAQYGQYK